VIKVLWGYWERDLTFGDTSNYFESAMLWAYSHQVNIVWSPLYTAYYGSWWSAFPDAIAATFAHRLILILASTALVAWLAFSTLPRILAIILVAWWLVLPIHYDTLYEVHLFGALPLILMGVVPFVVPPHWRYPLWFGLAAVTLVLLRNEYIIMLVVLVGFLGAKFFLHRRSNSTGAMSSALLRYGLVLAAAGALVASFYAMSFVKGEAISAWSKPKHTLNMCQVYAFGHQQRHPEWEASPWTECQGLMEEVFGAGQPTLKEMIEANPRAVAEHFWWNLSLAPAGLELLLFNVIGGGSNPDYAHAMTVPILPHVLLLILVCVGLFASYRVLSGQKPEQLAARSLIIAAAPVLVAAVLMAIAIILTQRPRPSYLLGFGVLATWLWLVLLGSLIPSLRRFDNTPFPLVILAVLIVVVPSYASLSLPSKVGGLALIYSEAKPHAKLLCANDGSLGIGAYATELVAYVCAPLYAKRSADGWQSRAKVMSLRSLTNDAKPDPYGFVAHLEKRGAEAVIVDPWFIEENPEVGGCESLRGAFLTAGWQLLAYRHIEGDRCVAIYHINA
jgi:hypothetical protein